MKSTFQTSPRGIQRSASFLLALLSLALLGAATGVRAQNAADDQFAQDVRTLTRANHRLAGSPEGRAAGEYIAQRLRDMGIADVLTLDMPVWQTRTQRCDLTVAGQTVPLLPLRPDLVAPPVTSAQGLTGPLLYVGRGELKDYGSRNPAGAIVVMDYDSADNWERALALGAKAIVFLGDAASAPVYPKYVALPANLVRLYATPQAQQQFNFKRDYPQATVVSQVRWEPGVGRNYLVYLPGSAPTFAGRKPGENLVPEMIALSAAYDSFGEVPELAPGARGAANVAALLQTVAHLRKNQPKRDVLVMFLDNDARYHQGARYVYETLNTTAKNAESLRKAHQDERDTIQGMRTRLDEVVKVSDLALQATPRPWYIRTGLTYLWIALVAVLFCLAVLVVRRLRLIGVGLVVVTILAGLTGLIFWQKSSAPKTADATNQLQRLFEALEREADIARADANQMLLESRMAQRGQTDAAQRQLLEQRIVQAQTAVSAWDHVRRNLRNRELAKIKSEMMTELARRAEVGFGRRLAELDQLLQIDAQRQALIAKAGSTFNCLHIHYNFAGDGPLWGVAIGDWTERAYIGVNTSGDSPGWYQRMLAAVREAQQTAGLTAAQGLAVGSLADTTMGGRYVPGTYVSSGMVAGTYGIYNISLMTSFDGRLRDGHPSDSLANLQLARVQQQAASANLLVQALGDSAAISINPSFDKLDLTRRPGWDNGRPTGDFVGLQVTGSLSEDRPASGAVLMLAPRGTTAPTGSYNFLRETSNLRAFDPVVVESVDANGRFALIGVRKNPLFADIMGLGAMFDEQGAVRAVTTTETIKGVTTGSMQFKLFPARGGVVVSPLLEQPIGGVKVLQASTDAAFRPNRSLFGQLQSFNFFYTSTLVPPQRVKVFQDRGPVMLNVVPDAPYGIGVLAPDLTTPPNIDAYAANDMYRLNNDRLEKLRKRGVSDVALEKLHLRAKATLDEALDPATLAKPTGLEQRQAKLRQSAALSRAVYKPLRQSMDDLVYAIVVLLLLAIPFAFALERLMFAATTIYRRLAGFAVMFILTFLLLYFMHPGFAIASTPIIIFLAFTILLLSSLVIYIIVRKFRTELKAMQGQGVGLHNLEVSRLGTLLAAVNMGMSTMRRRPTRTLLTAVTVVMLTFTILCFASVSSGVGVREVHEGPGSEDVAAGIFVRHLNYKALSQALPSILVGSEGSGGMIAGQYWLVRASETENPYSIARPDGAKDAQWLDGMLGLDPAELARWPQLAAVLGGQDTAGKIAALQAGGVFLPDIVREKLNLKIGDPILYHGHKVTFAGTIDAINLQRLTQLDGRPVLPVDLKDATSAVQESNLQQDTTVEDLVERDFVHLSPDQLAIASAGLVRELGGNLRVLNVYRGSDASAQTLNQARELAEMLNIPVWGRGPQGVERLIFTRLTQVTGGFALFVPVVLGGLIIFGTLLGSISDREKEIYTFSALGLAPGHVGFLFFAEASVYAVVGGMGGQLLAQCVALIAPILASQGWIASPSINYSSTNSLFAIGMVMATVLISAIYPAYRASKSANPGLQRSWRMPKPVNDEITLTFPFTVSAYDITGVVSFLAEHFRAHNDAGLGSFAAQDVGIDREENTGHLRLTATLALAPFDLGVTQRLSLTAKPSEIPGVDEVGIVVHRHSGTTGDWYRANRVFMQDLRKQFLLWRTLSPEVIEQYRMETLRTLGATPAPTAETQA